MTHAQKVEHDERIIAAHPNWKHVRAGRLPNFPAVENERQALARAIADAERHLAQAEALFARASR